MYSNRDLIELVDIFRSEEAETEWLEFKSNHISNQDIGEYISALSNGAALQARPYGYLIFGVDDKTHEIIGTTFDYRKQKQGNEDIENWLNRLVEPHIGFSIYEINYSALKKLVMFEIPAAYTQPTAFSGRQYVRIGSCRQDLSRYPEIEKRLWNMLSHVSYEQTTSPVQNLHFKQLSLIANSKGIEFSEDKFSTLRMLDSNGKFTNLAYLLSDENPHIVKFAVYKNQRMDFAVKKEFSGSWIAMLDQVLDYVNIYNDTSAFVIGNSPTRTEVQSYPNPSLREIVVNAFAHFDPSFPSDIKIEFYPNRVEIGSPGALYRTTMKEIFKGRQSFRNPNLVYVLNKFNYIENYATGLKKTADAYAKYSEKPIFESTENFFIVTLPNINYSESIDTDDTVNDTVNDTVKSDNDTVNDTDGTVKSKNGTVNDPVDPVNGINDLVNDPVKSKNGTVNDTDGTVKSKNGTVNDPVDPVNGINDPLNYIDGTINGINDPINNPVDPVNGTVKSKNDPLNDTDGTINDTVKSENDTVKSENDTVKPDNDTVNEVYEQIKRNTAITITVLMKEIGVSRPTITRAISELKEKGYIERVGSDKTGSWKILK